MTVASAVAEMVTIGAVLPVLAIAASAEAPSRIQFLEPPLRLLSRLTGQPPLVAATMFLVIAAVFATSIRLLLTWIGNRFTFGLMRDLTMKVFNRALHQPYAWYVQQNSSSLLSGLDKIAQMIFGVVSPGIQAATSAFTAICLIGLLFVVDPVVALAAMVSLGAAYALLILLASRRLREASIELAEIRTSRVQTVQESLGGLRDILLEQSQQVFYDRLWRIEDRHRRKLVLTNFMQVAPRAIVEGVAVVLIAALALWLSRQPGGLLAAVPTLGALAVGAQRLAPMAQSVYLGWAGYSTHSESINDVLALLDSPVEVSRREAAKPVPFERAITMQGVELRYPDGTLALSNIDLAVRRGEHVAVVGKTGSGKSTLVDVLMGLLPPSAGVLLVDDEAITGDRVLGWRDCIAHVPQAIFLRDASIRENIGFGTPAPDIEERKLRDAAENAGLLEFIESLPAGFETVVGERGVRLSGGQRQRIGIARALYKGAPVLILDEATSALDAATEKSVMQSVEALSSNLTVVLITHRLSTAASCDRVYRLEGGKIVAEGSFESVVGERGAVTRTKRARS